jgi:glutathione S-transferase
MARPVNLCNHSLAPNPRRVRIFAAEKGIELALEEINDITALVGIDIGGRLADVKIAPKFAHLSRWHETVSKRASARA